MLEERLHRERRHRRRRQEQPILEEHRREGVEYAGAEVLQVLEADEFVGRVVGRVATRARGVRLEDRGVYGGKRRSYNNENANFQDFV